MKWLSLLALLTAGLLGCTPPAPTANNIVTTEFVPQAGKGRVVVVLSGSSGPGMYAAFPAKLAKEGYFAVLIDGKSFAPNRSGGGEALRQIILSAQRSPHAAQGKVAVLGFSWGGGGTLAFATSLPDLIAQVVAFYPVTNKFSDKADVVRRWTVPTLLFAGDIDQTCSIGDMRALVAPLKDRGAPVDLIVYPHAGHDFILPVNPNPAAAEDAWQRTLAALRQGLGT
jgi:dienelactone hydrolase